MVLPPFFPPGICHTQEMKSVSRAGLTPSLLSSLSAAPEPSLLSWHVSATAHACFEPRLLAPFQKGTEGPEPALRRRQAPHTAVPGRRASRRGAGRSHPHPALPAAPAAGPHARRDAAVPRPVPAGQRAAPPRSPRRQPGTPPAPLTRCSCSGPGRAGGAAGALLPGPGARSLRHSNAAAVHAGPRALHHAPPHAPRGIAAPSAGRGLAPRPAAPRAACVTARPRGLGGGAAQPGGSLGMPGDCECSTSASALCASASRR